MVKFGRHTKFFLEHEHRDGSFVVPYNDIKSQIEEDDLELSAEEFCTTWKSFVAQARTEFDSSLQHLWQRVFDILHRQQSHHAEEEDNDNEIRGATPEKALVLLTELAPSTEVVHEILDTFKAIHATALVNAEALRKLVKKFDKNQQQQKHGSVLLLSGQLLPLIYASNFVVGLTALQQAVELLRSELGLGEYATATTTTAASSAARENAAAKLQQVVMDEKKEDTTNNNLLATPKTEVVATSNTTTPATVLEDTVLPTPAATTDESQEFRKLSLHDRKDSHAEHVELVDRRRLELIWLRQSIQRIDDYQPLVSHMVAHRGFHSPNDRSDRRPLENSLQAYETAWTSGIHLCECDIALTKDEKLILAHDDSFIRLALDDMCEKSNRLVRDLTFQEIMSVNLKSGTRPPLLLDVLQSAHAIGGKSQLIVEIKPGNREAASALARLFAQYPHLMAHCAAVMSFDSFAMHSLSEELDVLFGALTAATTTNGGGGGSELIRGNSKNQHKRSYSLGIFPSPAALANNPLVVPVVKDLQQNSSDNNLLDGGGNDSSSALSTSSSRNKAPKYARPKLLLLTVCESPKKDVELQVSVGDDDMHKLIHGWIKGLDGVYMQYEPKMLTPDGQAALSKLARRYHVGVWNHHRPEDPDDYTTFSTLVQKGKVSYVNTDLPRNFFHDELKEQL